jgi:hypothetical protein
MAFTAQEKYREAAREAMVRQKVYADLIKKGTLSPEEAERRIAIMREIATDYAKRAAAELPGI